jgi:hypothetical protein
MNQNLTPLNEPGQFVNRGLSWRGPFAPCDPEPVALRRGQDLNKPVVRGCVLVLLMFVLGLGGAGCGSIYQKTRATLPPEPCAQLKFRVDEAQRAEKLVELTITKLRDRLNQGLSGEAIGTDVDRVEAAAFEFERKVASAQDAAAHCAGQTHLASEIERFQEQSRHLLEHIQAVRRDGNSTNARQLEELLQTSAKP